MNMESMRTAPALATAALCAAAVTGCEAVFVPGWYEDAVEANLRVLVQAELREAQRLGLISVGEESVPLITDAQARALAQAVEEATVGEVDRAR